MIYRSYRVKETGQWAAPLMTDGRFPDDNGRADRVAATLGLPTGSLEVVDAESDPRTGELIEDPNVTPEPEPPAPDPQKILLAALAKEWTAAATELRANRPSEAAAALERAAQVARAAAQ